MYTQTDRPVDLCRMPCQIEAPCLEAGLKISPDVRILCQLLPRLGYADLVQVALQVVGPSFLWACLGPPTAFLDACSCGHHRSAVWDHFPLLSVATLRAHRHDLFRQVDNHSCNPAALACCSATWVTRFRNSHHGSSSYCEPSSSSSLLCVAALQEGMLEVSSTRARRRREPRTILSIFLCTARSLLFIVSFSVHASHP